MQRITIRHNGPIDNITININRVNVAIGEQATGKSTIAKSIYISRYVKTLVTNYLIQIMENNSYDGREIDSDGRFFKDIKENLRTTFVNVFGYSWELNPDFYIKYEFGKEIWFKLELSDYENTQKKYIKEGYSPKLKQNVQELMQEASLIYSETKKHNMPLELENETRLRNRKYIIQKVNDVFEDNLNTYYIPAGRSLLTLLATDRAAMNSLQNLDTIMDKFMTLIDGIRGAYHLGVSEAYRYYPLGNRKYDVHELSREIINMEKGEYISKGSEEKLIIRDEDSKNKISEIPISFSSSGQQELLWLLNFLYILILRDEKAFVIVEEPEAHIYPLLQREVVEYIIRFSNLCESSVFITTHSPYVLMSINNLYYAGRIIEIDGNKAKSVNRIIPRDKVIGSGKLTAIKILPSSSGGIRDLISFDKNEIDAYMIDEVSSGINEIYTELYNIFLDE